MGRLKSKVLDIFVISVSICHLLSIFVRSVSHVSVLYGIGHTWLFTKPEDDALEN
jgi:hypothetical protein